MADSSAWIEAPEHELFGALYTSRVQTFHYMRRKNQVEKCIYFFSILD